MMKLLVPCPLCEIDVPIPLLAEDGYYRAPELLPLMNHHVITVHEMEVSGT